MSTFAQELAAAKAAPNMTPSEATPAAAEAASALPAGNSPIDPAAVVDMNAGLNPAPAVEAAPDPVAAPAAPAAVETPKTTKIRIGTQEFNSHEEAIQYAQELELAVLQQDAFNAGKQAAAPVATETTPKRTIEDDIQEQLFENPKEALLKYKEHIMKNIKEEIKADAVREAQINSLWQEFYSENADLANSPKVVQMIVNESWSEIKDLPLAKSKRIIADRARKELSSYRQAAMPAEELPSKPAVVAGASGSPSAPATSSDKPKTALDFISQVNKHRKREKSGV